MITSSLVRLGATALIAGTLLAGVLCFPTNAHARTLHHPDGATTTFYDEDYDEEYEFDENQIVSYGDEEDARLQKQYDDYNAKHNLKTHSTLLLPCKDQYCDEYVSGSN